MRLFGLVLACTSPAENSPQGTEPTPAEDEAADSGDSAEFSDEDEPPQEYVYDTEETKPLLSSDDVSRAIEEGLATIFSIDPLPLHEAYEAMRALGDGTCPYYYDDHYEDYGQYYWRDTCTAGSGTEFSGYGYSYMNEDYWSSEDLYTSLSAYYYGAARIVNRDGDTLDVSGSSSHSVYGYPESDQWYHYNQLVGDFISDDASDKGTWLAQGLSVDLYFYGVRYGNYDPVAYYSSTYGSLAGLTGEVTALRWEEIILYSESLGSPCPQEPSGTFSIRDTEGEWYHVSFDGPAYWGGETFPPECDGCGEVWYRGTYLGDTCVDFGRLANWGLGDRPW